jgi:cytochrome P450
MSMNRYPPGPKDWLFGLRITNRFRKDPLNYGLELARTYGDVVYARMGPYRLYLVSHPDAIREVLVARAKSFSKFERQKAVFRQVDGEGLVISEGDFWLRQRRLIQNAFQSRRLGRYAEVAVRYTRRMLDRWPDSGELNLSDAMTHLTQEVIAKTMFDMEVGDQVDELRQAVRVLSEIFYREMIALVPVPGWLPWPGRARKRQAIRTLHGLIDRMIRERRASGEDKGDLLSMLLLAVDEEGDKGGMTDQQARDEAMTLFNGGHDSTAATLAWVWHLIARHPDVQARLAAEANEVLGERAAAFEDLARLRYTEQVIKESMRLYPAVPVLFLRQALADVEVAGYTVPRGSLVYVMQQIVHHDPRWYPDPDRFDPDRFAPGRVEQIPQYAYIPFGAGPHVCIGKDFALMEMTLIVATVLQHFRVELAPGHEEAIPELTMALRPRDGVHVRVQRRPVPAVVGAAGAV